MATLEEAISQLSAISPKEAGQLIKHNDWNTLVESVHSIGTEFSLYQTSNNDRVSALEARADILQTDLDQAKVDIDAVAVAVQQITDQVQPLLNQYIVSMSCERQRYSMGELCEITAEVRDLEGNLVTSEEPWIDFVSSWGRLRRKAGFESRGGVGDNSISVKVNEEGIAQVLLRTEHTEGFTESEEQEVVNSLQVNVQESSQSIANTLLDAASPLEFTAKAAFRALNVEYDRNDSIAVRSFVDTYFVRTPEWVVKPIRPNPIGSWRDYRATVMAFAKPDGNPATPDNNRGGSTIQVTFRDWVSYWINDYTIDTTPAIEIERPKIEPIWQLPVKDIGFNIKDFVKQAVKGKGIVGRAKYYNVVKEVLQQSGASITDPLIMDFRQQAIKAVDMQSANDVAQQIYSINGQSSQELSTMEAMIGVQEQSVDLGDNVGKLSQDVEQQKGVGAAVAVLEGRLQASEDTGSTISEKLTIIDDAVRGINAFDETSIQVGVGKLTTEISQLKAKLGV